MVNSKRGEVSAVFDGKTYTLCLTLGALASLEEALGAENLAELASRFSTGALRSNDLIKIITAGMNGGGQSVCESEVAEMKAEAGAAGFVEAAARLLTATFTPIDHAK